MKPRIFSGFLEKSINLCILKGKLPFKMHHIFFPEIEKNMCAYQKFSDSLYESHFFFYLALFIFRELGALFGNYFRRTGEQAHTFGNIGSTVKKKLREKNQGFVEIRALIYFKYQESTDTPH